MTDVRSLGIPNQDEFTGLGDKKKISLKLIPKHSNHVIVNCRRKFA